MPRDIVAERMAKLIRYCGRRRYLPELKVLARGLECSDRTVRRYLEALENAGFDVPKWRQIESVGDVGGLRRDASTAGHQ